MDDSAQPSSRQHKLDTEFVRQKIYEDENGYVLLDYLNYGEDVSLHLEFTEGAWTHNKYKKYKAIFCQILDNVRKQCYTEVWATPSVDKPKSIKLISMFGFKPICEVKGHVVMNRKV